MAKDDYCVIVYQILSYLYQCLKKGQKVEEKNLMPCNQYFQINENYWKYIIYNMKKYDLIDGITLINIDGMDLPHIANLDECFITPNGIEYLCDNSFMKKAMEFVKEAKEIIPLELVSKIKM